MTLKLLSSLTDSVSISVRLCLPSKSVCLQFCKVLSAFWMAWVQQDLTILTFMTFSLKEWSILITWIKNNSINIWMCFTLLVRYWLSSYDDQFQRLLAESIPILVVFFFFFSFSFFIPPPSLLQNVGEFWCTPKFSHQTISGQDYIQPEPNLTKSVEKFLWFQWYLNEAATLLIHEDTLLNLKEELP